MNWIQRFGVLSLVASALLAGATWGTQVNHAVAPVPIADLGLTPEAAALTQEAVAAMPPIQVVGADSDEDNRRKRVCLTAALYEINGNKWPWHGPQETGDCNAFATSRAMEIDLARQIKEGANYEFAQVDRPWNYYGARIRDGRVQLSGEGSVPSWGLEFAAEKGVLFVTPDTPPYSGQRAKQWGTRGPPKEFFALAEPYKLPSTLAAVRNAQEACNAICAGYPVLFGSMQFGTNSITLIEGRNVARDTTNWPHAQVAVTYDGTTQKFGEKGLFYIDNSWGLNAHKPLSQMPGDAPGGYYVTWATFDAICREGMAFAVSGTPGFPKRDLDWSDFQVSAVGMAPPAQPQGEWTMFAIDPTAGYGIAGALLTLSVALLILGRLGKNARRAAMLAGLALAFSTLTATPGVAIAGDALDWGAFEETKTTATDANDLDWSAYSVSVAASTPGLDFSCFDPSACQCKFGGKCDCKECKCDDEKDVTSPPVKPGMARPKYPVRPVAEWWLKRMPDGSLQQFQRGEIIAHLDADKSHGGHWDKRKLETMTAPELQSLHTDEHEGKLSQSAAWYRAPSAPRQVFVQSPRLVRKTLCNGGQCWQVWVPE